MAQYLIQEETLKSIADSVRAKTGATGDLSIDEMVGAVDNISAKDLIPELDNEGIAGDLMSGKELVGSDGEVVVGTFSIDNELNAQDGLIAQIQSVVDSLPEAGIGEPTLQNKTITPTASQQTVTPDSGYDGLSKVTVNAIPSTYVKPSTTKAATTYTPSTTNQTIAAGTYCSGVQTIKGDTNLIPANIVSGKSIFGVAGSATAGGGSGGAIESVTCTVLEDGPCMYYIGEFYYVNDSGICTKKEDMTVGQNLMVMKNSIIVISATTASGGVTPLISSSLNTYRVDGDFYINANM
jgi:hypothetical protein